MDIIYKHQISHNLSRDYFNVHTHPCYELYFMIRGTGSFVVEGHEYPLHPNSMVILRPGEMHRAEIDSDCDYERCYLHFSESTAMQLDPEGRLLRPFNDRLIGEKNFYSSDSMDTGFIREILLSGERMLLNHPNDKDKLHHYLFILLRETYNSFQAENHISSLYQPNCDTLIYEIIQYINQNICNEQSVSKIEKMFYISRPVLNKRFKHATGTTVWDYIITKRVVLADQLIAAGESATQAAYACGYNDYSSFYRAYRKVFHRSPRTPTKEDETPPK